MDSEGASFYTKPEAFHKLQLILPKVLKNDGELIPREIWHGENMENETVLNQIANMNDRAASISLAMSRLKRARELLDVFSFLKSSLENQISSFHSRMPKRTITDLPNELIHHIFDYSKPDLQCLRGLLQVCRRFRQLVLASPRLWARQTLKLDSSPYHIDTIAKRSGKLGFRASFDDEDYFGGSFGPEHTIFRHCKSWISLELHHLSVFNLQQFQKYAPCTNLTFLKELIIEHSTHEGRVWQFGRDWSLPSLRSLKCVDCIPQLLRASTLSVCSITFSDSFPLSDVTAFLSSSTSIERLSIALLSILSVSEGAANVTLPNLKSLTVHLVRGNESIITDIFRTILSPNITSFLVIVGILHHTDRGLRVLTKELNVRYPLLKKVGLGVISGVFDGEEASFDYHDVNETLEDLPKGVEDLVLLVRNLDCDISFTNGAVDTLEGLRSFGLVHCNYISEDFFDELPILLKRYGISLDSIHIENCKICNFHGIDLEDFKRMNDEKGRLIREGVTKRVAESRSVMMEEVLASLEEFLSFCK